MGRKQGFGKAENHEAVRPSVRGGCRRTSISRAEPKRAPVCERSSVFFRSSSMSNWPSSLTDLRCAYLCVCGQRHSNRLHYRSCTLTVVNNYAYRLTNVHCCSLGLKLLSLACEIQSSLRLAFNLNDEVLFVCLLQV